MEHTHTSGARGGGQKDAGEDAGGGGREDAGEDAGEGAGRTPGGRRKGDGRAPGGRREDAGRTPGWRRGWRREDAGRMPGGRRVDAGWTPGGLQPHPDAAHPPVMVGQRQRQPGVLAAVVLIEVEPEAEVLQAEVLLRGQHHQEAQHHVLRRERERTVIRWVNMMPLCYRQHHGASEVINK